MQTIKNTGPNEIEINGDVAYIILDKEHKALIDVQDIPFIASKRWHAALKSNNTAYAKNSKLGMMHRLLLPTDKEVDHINRNSLDNRRCNLRECSRSENSQNRMTNGGASKYKGVSWHKTRKMWVVTISCQKKKRWVGFFSDEKEAAINYNLAAKNLFGDFACLNIV